MDLIIDGNAFVNVALNVVKSLISNKDKTKPYNRSNVKYWVDDLFSENGAMLTNEVKVLYRDFCFTYLNSLLFPISSNLTGVHFVRDSLSWRKEFVLDFFENGEFKTECAPTSFEYKGNRKSDDYQYLFFDYFDEFLISPLIEHCNLNYYRVPNTEGDDIITWLCEKLGSDIFLYSVDHDFKQLVESTTSGTVSLMVPKQTSKTKKIFIPMSIVSKCSENVNEYDSFFSLSDEDIGASTFKTVVENFKNKGFSEFKVSPDSEILSKIVLGDGSDNIPRVLKMTPLKFSKLSIKVKDKFGDSVMSYVDSFDLTFLTFLATEIGAFFKITSEDNINEIREHLIFNIKIMRLNTKIFPNNIQKALDDSLSAYSFKKFKFSKFINLKNNLPSI
jgi:hypothetical protein